MAAILDELKKINITLQEHSTAIKSLESSKGIMRPLPSPTPHAETHGDARSRRTVHARTHHAASTKPPTPEEAPSGRARACSPWRLPDSRDARSSRHAVSGLPQDPRAPRQPPCNRCLRSGRRRRQVVAPRRAVVHPLPSIRPSRLPASPSELRIKPTGTP
uniref:Uncharacterized protein n=1 Tax=Oryza sativa subsp. japonica TaxID=39947 RepID=Q656C7_ORYSJ|nr:hypothetical protein [Oryza sativa Japonica Group]